MIRIRTVPDIFSHKCRSHVDVEFRGGVLADYVAKLPEGWRVIMTRKGEVRREDYGAVKLIDGDELIFTPVLGDPGSGLLAATITALKVTAWVGLNVAAQYGMSALMAQKPNLPQRSKSGVSDSQTYAWDGVRTSADAGVPVPVTYGDHLQGGNYINAYTVVDDDKSTLFALIAYGEGPVHSVCGITEDSDNLTGDDLDDIGDLLKLNGNPINNIPNAKVSIRLGNEEQTIIPGFQDLHYTNTLDGQPKLHKDSPYVYTTELSDVQAFRVHLRCDGLIEFDSSSDGVAPYNIKVEIYYRLHDSGDSWTSAGAIDTTRMTMSSVRFQFTERGLTPGRYDIRVIKKSGDTKTNVRSADVFITAVDEIRYPNLSYPYTVLIGLQIEASEKLSGILDDVTAVIGGRKVQTYTAGVADNAATCLAKKKNPVWCLLDFLTNTRYGLGKFIDSAHIDIANDWQPEADHCDEDVFGEDRYQLDIVLDSDQPANDLLALICKSFLCSLVWSGGMLVPLIERAALPENKYAMGNIISGSFAEDWPTETDVASKTVIQIKSAAHNYDDVPVEIEDAALVAAGNFYSVTEHMPGITRESQAGRIARILMRKSRFAPRQVRFQTGLMGWASRVMDVIEFSHDVPGWGKSGNVKSATLDTITLKDDVVIPTIGVGEVCVIRVKFADNTTEQHELDVASTQEIAAGTSIDLAAGETWATIPAGNEIFSLGITDLDYKPFRIVNMNLGSDGRADIVLEEYYADVYSDEDDLTIDTPDYSDLPDPKLKPQALENLTAVLNRSHWTMAWLSFSIPEWATGYAHFDHAQIYLSQDQTSWRLVNSTSSGNMVALRDLIPGKTYYVRAIAVSLAGVPSSSIDDAPEVSFVPLPPLPPNIRGLELRLQGNDTVFTSLDANFAWKHAGSQSTAQWPAGDEPYGAGSGTLPPFFSHYRVEIWTGTNPETFIRAEWVFNNYYSYTFAQNSMDHANIAQRNILVMVWAVDEFNQRSERPAVLRVVNNAPDEVTGLKETELSAGITAGRDLVEIYWNKSDAPDLVRYDLYFHVGTFAGDLPDNLENDLVWSGLANDVTLSVLSVSRSGAYAWIVAARDYFDGANYAVKKY